MWTSAKQFADVREAVVDQAVMGIDNPRLMLPTLTKVLKNCHSPD